MAKNKKEDEIDPESRKKIDNIINSIETACSDESGAKEILGVVISYLEDEQLLAAPLIEALAMTTKPEIAQLLYDMMVEIQDKSLIKLIKRSLYKLRQKGVKWKKKSQEDEPILKPLKSADPEGYLGGIDNTGSRIVIVTRDTPRGFLAAFCILNDLKGMEKLDLSRFSKKDFKEFLKSSVSSVDFPIVEAPGAYCISLLREAAALSKSLSNPLPQGYSDVENELKNIVWDYPYPIIYQYISEDEIKEKPHLLKGSGELHKVAPFFAWIIDPKELEQYADSIEEVHESRILLTPSQKDARLNSIYNSALEAIFPDEKRPIWKRRLEETAYILFKTGKDKEARLALSAAIDLKNPFSPIEPNPFIWNLLLKSIYSKFKEDPDEMNEDEKSSLIVAP